MSMAIEAAELMEHFQWISMDESRETPDNPEKLHDVGEEIADVICYAIALCNQLELDIATVVTNKMEKNVAKYPAEEFTGRYGHRISTTVLCKQRSSHLPVCLAIATAIGAYLPASDLDKYAGLS